MEVSRREFLRYSAGAGAGTALGGLVGLGLTAVQRARLDTLADSLDTANRAIGERVQAAILGAGNNVDPQVLFPRIQPMIREIQAGYIAGLDGVQRVLTAEQWAKVPARIKNPRAGVGPGGQGGGARPPF